MIIVAALTGGCASGRSLRGLSEDEPDAKGGFSSVLFWRVTILDGPIPRIRSRTYRNGEARAEPILWKEAPVEKADGNTASRQKVEMRGETLRYLVNDQVVGELKNALDLKEWFLGVTVCGKQTVEFSKLRVIER